MDVYEIALQDELAKLIALIVREREKLENADSKEVLASITVLTKAFESASRSKLALDKAQVDREKKLTPEEELKHVMACITAYSNRDRYEIIGELVKQHNKLCVKNKSNYIIRMADAGI